MDPVPAKEETIMETDQAFKAILENKEELYNQGVEKPLAHHTGKMLRIKFIAAKSPLKKVDLLTLRSIAKRRLADEASLIVEVTPIGLYKDMMADNRISVLSPTWKKRILSSVERISSMEVELTEFIKGHENDQTVLYHGPLVELENTRFEGNGKLKILSSPSTLTAISLPLSQFAVVPFRYFHPELGRKKQTRLEHSVIKEYALYRLLDEISIVSRKSVRRKILLETILDGAGVSRGQICADSPVERRQELRRHGGFTRFLKSYLDNLCQVLKSEGRLVSYEIDGGALTLFPNDSSETYIDSVQKGIKPVPMHSDSVHDDSDLVKKHIESVASSIRPYSNISDIAEATGVKQAHRLKAVPVPARVNEPVEAVDE